MMATTTSEAEVHSKPLNFKTWVLKVSIHCEGCKKKVKKILNSVPGVTTIDIDAKQHKVIVTGNVEGDALLRKLFKSGKHAELLFPDNPPQISPPNAQLENGTTAKDIPHAKDLKQPPPPPQTTNPAPPPPDTSNTTGQSATAAGGAGTSTKNIETISADTSSSNDGAKATGAAVDKSIEAGKAGEEKKPGTDSSGNQTSPPILETKGGETEKSGGGGGNGSVGKRKKKKGQNGNGVVAEPSSVSPASAESPNHSGGPPPTTVSSNASPPRYYGYPSYPPPSHYYAPPAAPIYAVNYNTAQPSSSYTASYYASPAPQSYAYSYPGQEMGPPVPPPPSDYDPYPRQPLDSFEMFSDENPNGCFVM